MKEDGESDRLLLHPRDHDFGKGPRPKKRLPQDLFGDDAFTAESFIFGKLADEREDNGNVAFASGLDVEFGHSIPPVPDQDTTSEDFPSILTQSADTEGGLYIQEYLSVSNQSIKGFFAVRCAPCQGSGRMDERTDCATCKGFGTLLLQGTINNYRDCPNCGASGFTGFKSTAVCAMCHGVGAVQNP